MQTFWPYTLCRFTHSGCALHGTLGQEPTPLVAVLGSPFLFILFTFLYTYHVLGHYCCSWTVLTTTFALPDFCAGWFTWVRFYLPSTFSLLYSGCSSLPAIGFHCLRFLTRLPCYHHPSTTFPHLVSLVPVGTLTAYLHATLLPGFLACCYISTTILPYLTPLLHIPT